MGISGLIMIIKRPENVDNVNDAKMEEGEKDIEYKRNQ